MAKKKGETEWKNFYKIPPDPYYVHSKVTNFEKTINHHNVTFNDVGGIRSKILPVVIEVLKSHLPYWEGLRDQFIQLGKEKQAFANTKTPEDFLEKWNESFAESIAKDKIFKTLSQLYEVREKYVKVGRTSRKVQTGDKSSKFLNTLALDIIGTGSKAQKIELAGTEKEYLDFMTDNFNVTIRELIRLYIQVLKSNRDLANFQGALKTEQITGVEKDLNTRMVFIGINKLIANLPKSITKGKTGLEALLEFKKHMVGFDGKDPTTLEAVELFYTSLGRQSPKMYILGDILNPAMPNVFAALLEMTTQRVADNLSENVQVSLKKLFKNAKGRSTGDVLKDITTTDTMFFELDVDIKESKKIFFGASIKSVEGNKINRSYSTEPADFLNSKIISGVEGSQHVKLLQWIRANISSLDAYNADGKSSVFQEVETGSFVTVKRQGKREKEAVKKTVSNIPFYQDYLDLETELSAMMLIPRIFDGVFDYQEEITLKDFEGSIIHTAIINMKEGSSKNVQFVWVYDLLKKMIESLETKGLRENPFYSYKPESKYSPASVFNIQKSVNKSTLEAIWQRKQALYTSLNKKGQYITYESLIADSSLRSSFEDIYKAVSFKSPVSTIYADIKLSGLKLKKPKK